MQAVHETAVDRHDPARVALVEHGGGSWTFGGLAAASRRLAHHLRHAEGVARGDRVALVLGQRVEAALVHLACSRLGAIAVPLSPLFGRDGLASRLDDAQARLVLTTRDRVALVPHARALAVDDAPSREAPELARSEEARVGPEDPMWLVYTSGTTARPKGALLPHRVLEGRMPGFRLSHAPLSETIVFHSPADWSWIGGLLDSAFAPWQAGCAVVAHERRGAFDPASTFRLLAEHGVTDAFFPPTALKALARAGVDPPVRMRAVHSAGEPLPPPVAEWARRRFCGSLAEVYGLTEAAFLVGTAAGAPAPEGSMGRPYPGHDVRLVEGEICVGASGPTVMLGYWRGPDAAPELPLDEARLLHTGDLACEEDGWLRFEGRKDDLIKTSGHRVGPAEVEAMLLRHPAVAECAVIGVPDAERGQRVKAFVALARGASASAEELSAFVRTRLAAHAYPREIEFVDELPMTVSGKLRRRELRER